MRLHPEEEFKLGRLAGTFAETEYCEWFTYIRGTRTCKLKRTSTSRNLRRVARSLNGNGYFSGSVLSSALSSPNCHCPGGRYTTASPARGASWQQRTTTEGSNFWGWTGWHNPCPVGPRQNQNLFGTGMITCCPVQAGTDGTPVCRW